MTVRILSQSISLLLSILTMGFSVTGMRIWPAARPALLAALVYGIVEFSFYVIVLIWKNYSLANSLSPMRALIENVLVFTFLSLSVVDRLKQWKS